MVPEALRTGLRDVARLVLPVRCPGCGAWDEPLCRRCAAALGGALRRCEDDLPHLGASGAPLPVWAVCAYAGPVRGVVVAWKDRGRADLTRPLAAVLARAGAELAPVLGAAAAGGRLVVVPVPTTAAARRRRGADLVRQLAEGTVTGLRSRGVDAAVRPLLRRTAGVRDQVGLGARARGRNAAGSVTLRGRRGRGGDVHLLVDDVVTTGSTLAAVDAVLSASGRLVLGALVIAATPPPSRVEDPLRQAGVGG